MQDQIRVAAAAADTQPGRIDENLEKIEHWTSRAREQGAQLVLFPELSLTGFIPNHPTGNHETWLRDALRAARQTSLALDSPAMDSLRDVARRNGVLVSVGLLEDAGNVLYNAQILVGPSGLV